MCSIRFRRLLIGGLLLLVLLCAVASVIAYRFIGPSPACRHPADGPAEPGTSARTLVSGGRERCYLLYLPPGHDPTRPAPLVVSLHGFASNGEVQARLPRWNGIADAEGLVLAYPNGTVFPLRWNASDAFQVEGVDDVQFFRDLVADVSHLVAIDPTRIYVNGMSNGGAMTNRIACEAADLVAAAGTVAAVPGEPPGSCTPSRPVPLIAFHGLADPLVPYEGGIHQIPLLRKAVDLAPSVMDFPPVETWIADWAERNGCAATPEAIPASGDTSGIRYTGCRDGAEVLLYTIDDGGHTWPGGAPIPFVGKTSQDIDASATMWEFFKAHPLDLEATK